MVEVWSWQSVQIKAPLCGAVRSVHQSNLPLCWVVQPHPMPANATPSCVPCAVLLPSCACCSALQDWQKKHELDRKSIAELVCALCDTRQPVSTACTACGVQFGERRRRGWLAGGQGGQGFEQS